VFKNILKQNKTDDEQVEEFSPQKKSTQSKILQKSNDSMKITINMLQQVELLKENDRIFNIPEDAGYEKTL